MPKLNARTPRTPSKSAKRLSLSERFLLILATLAHLESRRSFVLSGSLALVILAGGLTGCAEHDPTALTPDMAVVRIDAKAGSPGRGFLVSPDGLIVTRLHLIDRSGDITVTRSDGQKLFADFVQGDQDADLAIVKVHAKKLPFLKLYDDDVEPGMHARILGTGGVTHSVLDQWEDYGKKMAFTATLLPTDSGAPILGDDERVIAVVGGTIEGQATQYDATPVWRIFKMMPSIGQKFWTPDKPTD